MKKITLLLLLTLSIIGAQAQTPYNYQLNYGNIRYGLLNGTSYHSIFGQVDLKNVGVGSSTDSILTVVNGRIKKVAKSVTISQVTGLQDSLTNKYSKSNADARFQALMSGTGIVKSTGGTISYLTDNSNNWNTAYGWGNHAGLYPLYNGTGASGTWGIGISGNSATTTLAANSTLWGGAAYGGPYLPLTSGSGSPLSGGLSLSGSITGGGYTGGELQFNTTTANAYSGITSMATGTPTMYFDHRATGNTGNFVWRNGSGGGNTLMKLETSLGGSGNVIIGADNTGLLGKIAIGSGLSLSSGTLTATGGSAGTVTGSGTSGKLAVWNSASDIGDSPATVAGSNISVSGSINSATGLNVTGNGGFFNGANKFGLDNYLGASRIYSSGSDASTRGTYEFHVTNSTGSLDAIGATISNTEITANSFSGAGTGLTGTASSLNIGGNSATATNVAYSGLTGTVPTWNQSTTGNAATATNSTQWSGLSLGGVSAVGNYMLGIGPTGQGNYHSQADVRTFLGLGSNAYTSTAYAPISNPTFTGTATATTFSGALSGNASTATTTNNWGGNTLGSISSIAPNYLFGAYSGGNANYSDATAVKSFLSLVKGDVGLGNVDNTSDASKPVSTATQTALDLKANLASPALTGTPTAPTATVGDNSTKIATTAYVDATASSGSGSTKQTAVIFADVNSSSTGAVNLSQHSVSTSTNGDKTSFEYSGIFANNANNKPQMILTVDGTDFTIPSITPGTGNNWIISGSIIRVSNVAYRIYFDYSQTGNYTWPTVSSGVTLDTNSLTITLTTPTTVASSDIVLKTASIQKFNAP